jgi:hypothetical protein
LLPAIPASTDAVGSGDDELRKIKQSLVNSFPAITAPVTPTAADINLYRPELDALRTDVNGLTSGGAFLQPGLIMMWSDLSGLPIPDNWVECDGQAAINGVVIPDLRDRFIIGANFSPVDSTGGAATLNSEPAGAHTHSVQVAGHALVTSQLPAHSHRLFHNTIIGADPGVPGPLESTAIEAPTVGDSRAYKMTGSGGTTSDVTNGISSETGGGDTHTHAGSTTGDPGDHVHEINTLPPFYALRFIIYVGVVAS